MKYHSRPTRHHVIPRVRGGHNGEDNIVLLDEQRHELYHKLFGTRTPDEAMAMIYYQFTTPAWRARNRVIER